MFIVPGTSEDVTIVLAIGSGTHYSGKSTLVQEFEDSAFAERHIYPNHAIEDHYLRMSGSDFMLAREDETVRVPVLTCEEAATRYAELRSRPELLATDYSFDTQLEIESLASSGIVQTLSLAHEIADRRPPIKGLGKAAIVLCDRGSVIDGQAYSNLRTPDYDQALIDLDEHPGISILRSPSEASERVIPLRKWHRSLLESADVVLWSDHTEIRPADSPTRLADEVFRETVAVTLRQLYKQYLPDVPVHVLNGSPPARAKQARRYFAELLSNLVAV